jgi:hypothetical protein
MVCRFSWVHRDDLAGLIVEALQNPKYEGKRFHSQGTRLGPSLKPSLGTSLEASLGNSSGVF